MSGRYLYALTLTTLLTSGCLSDAAVTVVETSLNRGTAALQRSNGKPIPQDSIPSLEELAEALIGRTVDELKAAYPGSRDTSYSDPVVEWLAVIVPIHGAEVAAVPCAFYDLFDDGHSGFSGIPRGTIGSLETSDKSVRTSAGLGPASTFGEIRATLGEVTIFAHETVGVWVRALDGRHQVRYVLDGFDRAVWAREQDWANNKLKNPELMPDSAVVTRVFVVDHSKCPEDEQSGFVRVKQ